MQRAFLFCFLLVFCFFAGKYVSQTRWEKKEVPFFPSDGGFRPALIAEKKCSFVLIVAAYNNGAFVEKALRSIVDQQGVSFRLIYIDDGSTDGSASLARYSIGEWKEKIDLIWIENEESQGIEACWKRGSFLCKEGEIAVCLAGDEWFAHRWVLQDLEKFYQHPDLWMAFAMKRKYPSLSQSSCFLSGYGHILQEIETPFFDSSIQKHTAWIEKTYLLCSEEEG